MPSLGEARASAPFTPPAAVLQQARERERAGSLPDAIERYGAAIAAAEQYGDPAVLAETFLRALELGGASQALRARAEQNLGIVANIQGQLNEAVARYERSLDAYRSCGDEHGCALAYHNLGMVSADRGRLDAADCYFQESRAFAERVGDVHLWALCLVNHAEVHVARQRFEDARQNAESALALFDQIGVRAGAAKADAYRVIGMVYRETGRPALGESRLRSAIDLARAAGSVLGEAEASRELALLHQTLGRNEEALRLLNAAYRLFRRLDARVDLVYVGGKMAELEGSYLALVREWGQSIESSDNYTYGHCARVAKHAVAMARALAPVDFPWDLKPIIRSHHERYDGTGYPDRLKGDEIPLGAQIVGILDAFDALTTTHAYQAALPVAEAIAQITRRRGWWSDRVFEAFLKVVPVNGPATPAAAESAESP